MEKITEKFPGTKVLVVDDYAFNIELTTDFLEMMACDIETAISGQEAIEKCKKTVFDIIFMDIQMPEMDGYEAAKKIRSLKNDSAKSIIIALTANVQEEDRNKCLKSGMNDYTQKPIKGITLEKLIKSHLGQKP